MRFKIPEKEDLNLSALLSVHVSVIDIVSGRRTVKFTKPVNVEFVKNNDYYELDDALLTERSDIQFQFVSEGKIKTVSVDKKKNLRDLFGDYIKQYADRSLFLDIQEVQAIPCYVIDTGVGVNTAEPQLREAGFKQIFNISSRDIADIQERRTYNHGLAWKSILDETDYARFFIIDSDCVLSSVFLDELLKIKGIIHDFVDVLFLGGNYPEKQGLDKNYCNFVENLDCFAYMATRKTVYSWIAANQENAASSTLEALVGKKENSKFALLHTPYISDNYRDFRIKGTDDLGLVYKSKKSLDCYPCEFHDEELEDLEVSKWLEIHKSCEYTFKSANYLMWAETDKQNAINLVTQISFPSTGVLSVNDAVVCPRGLVFNKDLTTRYSAVIQLGSVKSRTIKNSETNLTWFSRCSLNQKGYIPIEYKGGKALNLTNLFGNNNLCHALLDSLGSGLHILNSANIDISDFDWYILPSFKNSIILSLYRKLNIPENKIIHAGLKYFPETKSTRPTHKHGLLFKSVVTPSFSGYGRLYRKGSFLQLRELFKNEMQTSRPPHRLIFLSREGGGRDINNLEEFKDMLFSLGFEPVHASTQIDLPRLMNEAKVVIGAHGAAMANCVFCSTEATLIDLLPAFYVSPYYMSLAEAVGFKYFGIVCSEEGGNEKTLSPAPQAKKNIRVDVQKFKSFLVNSIL